MKKVTLIAIILCMAYSCNSNKTKMEKRTLSEFLIKVNNWFERTNKEISSIEVKNIDSNNKLDKKKLYEKYLNNSVFFTEKFKKESFGSVDFQEEVYWRNLFLKSKLSQTLFRLCLNEKKLVEKELNKVDDSTYQYITHFANVLRDIPNPDQVDGFDWLMDKGENGERWQFCITIIKENGKWAIDDIGKIMAVPGEVYVEE